VPLPAPAPDQATRGGRFPEWEAAASRSVGGARPRSGGSRPVPHGASRRRPRLPATLAPGDHPASTPQRAPQSSRRPPARREWGSTRRCRYLRGLRHARTAVGSHAMCASLSLQSRRSAFGRADQAYSVFNKRCMSMHGAECAVVVRAAAQRALMLACRRLPPADVSIVAGAAPLDGSSWHSTGGEPVRWLGDWLARPTPVDLVVLARTPTRQCSWRWSLVRGARGAPKVCLLAAYTRSATGRTTRVGLILVGWARRLRQFHNRLEPVAQKAIGR
jgi:hypothetical protein